MTISVDSKVEQEFRKTVRKELGSGKGKLGQAISEAMQKWVEERRQKRAGRRLLALMEKGFDMGKWKPVSRDELHERH